MQELAKTGDKPLGKSKAMNIKKMLAEAKLYLASGFLPDAIKKPEQVVVIMAVARDLQIPPMYALNSINVIRGKPCQSAELMRALIFRKHPDAIFEILEHTDKICCVKAARPNGKSQKFSYTIEQAKRAGLTSKTSWQQYPEALLLARVTSVIARAIFPDVLMGVSYTPEELGVEIDMDGKVVEYQVLPEDKNAPTIQAFEEIGISKAVVDKYCEKHFKHNADTSFTDEEIGELRTIWNSITKKNIPREKYFDIPPQPPAEKPPPAPDPEKGEIQLKDMPDPTAEHPPAGIHTVTAKADPPVQPPTPEPEQLTLSPKEQKAQNELYEPTKNILLKMLQRHRNEFKPPEDYSFVINAVLANANNIKGMIKYAGRKLEEIGVDVDKEFQEIEIEKAKAEGKK